MILQGDYLFEDLRRALQGVFSCQSVKTDTRKKPLGDGEYIALNLFFMRFEFYPKRNEVMIFTSVKDEKGARTYQHILTLAGK